MSIELVLGGAFATGVGWFLVKFLTKLVWAFKDTVDNNMAENTKTLHDVQTAIQVNTMVLKELTSRLRINHILEEE